jgi:hypothetical protein
MKKEENGLSVELHVFVILDQFILRIDINIYDMSKRHLKLVY